MDIPGPAQALLEERYGTSTWTLLHAWMSDDTVLAVVAVADEECFDANDDAFDVDAVRIEAIQLFDTIQEGWALEEDTSFELGDVFGELVQAFQGDSPVNGEALNS